MSLRSIKKPYVWIFYDKLKATFDECWRLIYTDTDSFVLQLVLMTSARILEKVRMIWISATHYPSSQKMYDTTKKGILGKFKSETFETTDFCGLKPK